MSRMGKLHSCDRCSSPKPHSTVEFQQGLGTCSDSLLLFSPQAANEMPQLGPS